MRVLLSLLFATMFASISRSALISSSAGRVGQHVVTTREVMLNHLIEGALFPAEKQANLDLEKIKTREFVRETTSVLLEYAIASEAITYSAAVITKERLQSSIKKVERSLRKDKVWVKLQPTPQEIKRIVEYMLKAKDFIKFKVDAVSTPVTNQEAEDYFNANRLKFENLPFSSFKENIKAYLKKQRVDTRLKDWFDQLQSKYSIRNFLAE